MHIETAATSNGGQEQLKYIRKKGYAAPQHLILQEKYSTFLFIMFDCFTSHENSSVP